MLKLVLVLIVVPLLAGCSYAPAPVVDMAGVDPVTYSHDLGACTEYAHTHFAWGDGTTACLRDKGYKILSTPSAF
jgi:hypothetical protein